MRADLLIALEPQDAKGENLSVAVTVIAPDPAAIGERPIAWFAWPGGGYNRRYYDLQLPGRSGYSQAEFHAARGSIFVACDHIGVGDSATPSGAFNHSDIACINAAVVRKVLAGLADGTLIAGLPALTNPFPLGMGQSYGGLLLTHLQAEHGLLRGVAMLGWSGVCTQVKDVSGTQNVAPPADLAGTEALQDGLNHPYRRSFHFDDVPEDIVAEDLLGYPARIGVPVPAWGTPFMPGGPKFRAGAWSTWPQCRDCRGSFDRSSRYLSPMEKSMYVLIRWPSRPPIQGHRTSPRWFCRAHLTCTILRGRENFSGIGWKAGLSVSATAGLSCEGFPFSAHFQLRIMSTIHLVDPLLATLVGLFPDIELSRSTLVKARADSDARSSMLPPPPIEPTRCLAPGRDGVPDVPVFVFKPDNDRLRPAILHIHGGGMVMGSAYGLRHGPSGFAAYHDIVVVSVDYRLAPETPFPGPQEDCYTALEWLLENAETLGVDTARIALMGESAGGGLAAALAQMVRDRGQHCLRAQILVYPMLDHRTGSAEDPYNNPSTGEFVWTRDKNQFGWDCLRGDYALDDDRLGWFSPSLAADLSNLPPAYITTGTLDLFFDESLEYARQLSRAGCSVELRSYAGGFHGFNFFSETEIANLFYKDLQYAIARLL
jgi:acetyl esterase